MAEAEEEYLPQDFVDSFRTAEHGTFFVEENYTRYAEVCHLKILAFKNKNLIFKF